MSRTTTTTDRPMAGANGFASLLDRMPELAPLDEFNRELASNAHPPDWANPRPRGRYNLVVIGGGTAGLVTAAGAAGLGAKVALVERRLLGGDCLNVGCVPSKALIRCARAAAQVRDAHQFGVGSPEGAFPDVDFPKVMQRMRRLRAGISPHDSAARFRDLGVDVFIGDASFIDGRSVQVGDAVLSFARAVIATGARASAPPIPGLHETGYLTNETVFSLTELPGRLAVIGAGPIGCELAQAMARFGSKVALVEAESRIMPRESAEAAAIIERALTRDGVRVICGGKAAQVRTDGGEKVIALECEGRRIELRVDEILVGVGRAPNVQGLNLEAAGVEYDARDGVKVDDFLRTANRRIYAAGDVCSPLKFTHHADAQARIVIQNALFFGRARASGLVVPWCTYTDPEVAHVGMHAHEAHARGIEVSTIRIDMSDVDRAVLDGEEEGFLEVHIGPGSDHILGATLVASHAGDMIGAMSLAMTNGLGLKAFARTIHPYPTQGEIMKKAGDAFNRTRLSPRVKSLFSRFLAWRR